MTVCDLAHTHAYIILMHISCFMFFFFFANDLLLAVYFIFILDQGSDVRQKENLGDFIIEIQIGL